MFKIFDVFTTSLKPFLIHFLHQLLFLYWVITKGCVTSKEKGQRWNNVDRQFPLNLFYQWYVVENESWTERCLLSLFQRWQDNIETMLIALFFFKVVKKKFSKNAQYWFNDDILLKTKVYFMYVLWLSLPKTISNTVIFGPVFYHIRTEYG